MTKKLIITDESAANLKQTFKGIFAVVKGASDRHDDAGEDRGQRLLAYWWASCGRLEQCC